MEYFKLGGGGIQTQDFSFGMTLIDIMLNGHSYLKKTKTQVVSKVYNLIFIYPTISKLH